ncbi:hypothetical protein [Acetobacter oryzifermentans]|uniref:DUF551 domain-containing protein n=1 Tax=Acetobacter oryzifermentans TaxID=1633874 RepID=A0ABM6AKN7_9PROT|nr:hypothetical protein [Acetobacter oryzifermentans]ANA14201.1 hypothetical protein WG31_09465 [Acetobacter oryzifermentans]
MTDPRIEAAVEAAWSNTFQFKEGISFPQYQNKSPEAAAEFHKAITLALAAADAAAWRPIETAPQDGTVIEIFQGNHDGWQGIGIATAQYWSAEKLAELDGSSNPDDYEGGWFLATNYWGAASDETRPWLWRPLMPPRLDQQESALQQLSQSYRIDPYPKQAEDLPI